MLGALMPLEADTVEEKLSSIESRFNEGAPDSALGIAARLVNDTSAGTSAWTQVVEILLAKGYLDEAASHAETVLARTRANATASAGQDLLAKVMKMHDQELDRVLAFKTWPEVGQSASEFASRISKILRRVARTQPAKAESVMRQAVRLLGESPEHRGAPSWNRGLTPSEEFLALLGNTPELMGAVLAIADSKGLLGNHNWRSRYRSCMFDRTLWQDAAFLKALFTSTPLVADSDRYQDVYLGGLFPATLLGELTDRLRWSEYSEIKIGIITDLAARKPRTLGLELCETLLKAEDQPTALMNLLSRKSLDVRTLHGPSASVLVALLASKIPALTAPDPLTPGLEAAVRPFLEAESLHLTSVLNRWQDARSPADLGTAREAVITEAARLYGRLVVKDRDRAARFLELVCVLGRKDPDDRQGQFLPDLLRQVAEFPETLKDVMKMAEREGVTARDEGWIMQAVRSAWKPARYASQPARLIIVMNAADLLGDASALLRGPGQSAVPQLAFVKQVADSLAVTSSVSAGVVSLIDQKNPRTPGQDIMLALATPVREQALMQACRDHKTELAALSPDLQTDAVHFLGTWMMDLNGLAQAVPAFEPLLKSRLAELRTRAFEEVDKVLDASNPQDYFGADGGRLGQSVGSFGDPPAFMVQMAQSIAIVADLDAKKAEAGFKKYTQMIVSATPHKIPPTQKFTFGTLPMWLQACLSHPGLVKWVSESAKEVSTQRSPFWVKRVEDALFPEGAFANPAVAVLLLQKGGLLEPAATLRPAQWDSEQNSLDMAAKRIRNLPYPVKEQIELRLKARVPYTLGTGVMATISHNTRTMAEKLSEAHQKEFLTLAPDVMLMVQKVLINNANSLAVNRSMSTGDPSARVNAALGLPPPASPPAGSTSKLRELEKLLKAGDIASASQMLVPLLPSDGQRTRQEPSRLAWLQSAPDGGPQVVEGLLQQAENTGTIALLLARVASDTSGTMGVPGPTMVSLLAGALEQAWFQGGGLVEPVALAQALLQPFAVGLGNNAIELQGPVLAEFLNAVPASSRVKILEWAASCNTSLPLDRTAAEMVTSWKMREAVREGKVDPSDPRWERWLRYAGNPETKPRASFAVAAYWCREAGSAFEQLPPPLVILAARHATTFWSNGEYVPTEDMMAVMGAYSRMGDSPEWRQVGQAVAATSEKYAIEAKTTMVRSFHADLAQSLFAILSRMGKETTLEIYCENSKYTLPEEFWPVAVMAQNGLSGPAAYKLTEHWSRMTGTTMSVPKQTPLPLATDSVVRSFLQAFPSKDTDLALLGELALLEASKPKVVSDKDPVSANWSARVDPFVAKVLRTKVTNAPVRRALHARLVQMSPRHLTKLESLIRQEVADAGVVLEDYRSKGAEAWPVELMAMAAAIDAQAGDLTRIPSDLIAISEAIRRKNGGDNWTRHYAVGSYLFRFFECIASSWPDLSEDQRAAVMQSVVQELKQMDLDPMSSTPIQGVRWIVEWWAAGTGKDLVGLPKLPYGSRLSDFLLERAKVAMVNMSRPGKVPLSEATRVALGVAAMNKPELQEKISPHGKVAPSLQFYSAIISPAEMVKAGAQFSSVCKRGGRTAYEIAMIPLAEGRNEEALELLKLAEDEPSFGPGGEFRYASRAKMPMMAPPLIPRSGQGKVAWSREWIYEAQVVALLRLNRNQEASDILSRVPESFLTPWKVGLAKILDARPK